MGIKLGQSTSALDIDHPYLAAPAGAMVIRRRVVLRGVVSSTDFAEAKSLIAVKRLPQLLTDKIESGGEGLGQLLNRFKIEVRRELLFFGAEKEDGASNGRHSTRPEMLTRTYRIFCMAEPVMVITEWFPLDAPGSPAD